MPKSTLVADVADYLGLNRADIGPRSVVATGPKELQAAKWELEESTEKFIQTIEKIIFPYVVCNLDFNFDAK